MGHFYDRLGNAQHTIRGKNGKTRDTTIVDARKNGWVPSVTTITSVLAKPGLKFWQDNQLLEAAIDTKIPVPFGLEQKNKWKAVVLKKANKITEDSQKEGNRIHKLLELHFKQDKNYQYSQTDLEIVPVLDLIWECFGECDWISEASFSNTEGFAGQIDLHSKNIIIDFKTKTKPIVNKECMTNEYLMQIAAYRKGLDLPNAKCYNLFISTSSGNLYLHENKEKDLVRGWDMFKTLLTYYNLVNKL